MSAGHVNCHGDPVCGTGQREAGVFTLQSVLCLSARFTLINASRQRRPPAADSIFTRLREPLSLHRRHTAFFFFIKSKNYLRGCAIQKERKKKKKKKTSLVVLCGSITVILTLLFCPGSAAQNRWETYCPRLQRAVLSNKWNSKKWICSVKLQNTLFFCVRSFFLQQKKRWKMIMQMTVVKDESIFLWAKKKKKQKFFPWTGSLNIFMQKIAGKC